MTLHPIPSEIPEIQYEENFLFFLLVNCKAVVHKSMYCVFLPFLYLILYVVPSQMYILYILLLRSLWLGCFFRPCYTLTGCQLSFAEKVRNVDPLLGSD
jgi:hypothetical protein